MFENSGLYDVTVININSGIKTITDNQGNFSIKGNVGNELRFTKLGFERTQYFIKESSNVINIDLQRIVEIEEVNIKKIPTGDLAKDSQTFGINLKERLVNDGVRHYIKKPSDLSVLQPKPGEFIQPVGQGFSMGGINNKWEITDFVKWIRNQLTDDYFSLFELYPNDIDRFLYLTLATYNQDNKIDILKYGFCSNERLAQLQMLFEKTILTFKKS